MPKNTVTQEQINDLIDNSEIEVSTRFDKVTIVSVRLPHGFVITEACGAVDPANYSEIVGAEICLGRIKNKLWELEGYALSKQLNLGGK